jgi:outer membrane protein assembly factor BamB
MKKVVLLLGTLALGAGCRSIPLSDDFTRSSPESQPVALFDVEWWVKLVDPGLLEYSPRERASPAVDAEGQRVVVCTRDGRIRALALFDGKRQWEVKTSTPFTAGARVEGGVVYVPGGDGNLYALKSATGAQLWKYGAGEELATIPVIAEGKVLVATSGNTLIAVDASNGKWLWQYRRDLPPGFTIHGTSAPRVSGKLAYIGFSDGQMVALNLDDGTVKWERTLSAVRLTSGAQFIDVDTTPAVDDQGRVFVASYQDGLYALDGQTGAVLWKSPQTGVTSLLPGGDVLFIAGDGQVSAVLRDGGRTLWSIPLKEKAARQPLFVGGLVVVPTQEDLLFIDPAEGKIARAWDPGKGVSATPVTSDGRLYILSNYGSVFALRLHGRGG